VADERTYTCADCPPGKVHTTTKAGRLPERCPQCRKARKAQTNRDGKARRALDASKAHLHIVPEPASAPDLTPAVPPAASPAPAQGSSGTPFVGTGGNAPGSVLDALREDLGEVFSTHPAATTLRSVAEVLADVLDSPIAQADGRIAATVAKELRAVVHELTSAKAEEDDDLFSQTAGPSVVGG
jgi:hypothetical protein